MEEKKDLKNRRRVDRIKRMIMFAFVSVCALPILFCLYLMLRMNSVERKIDLLYEQMTAEAGVQDKLGEATENVSNLQELEAKAYDNLAISQTEGAALTYADENSAEKTLFEQADAAKDTAKLNGKKVYLTFDDGPSSYTNQILDILEKNNVKATFFVVYNRDRSTWPSYRRIVEDGHTLAMHSYTHDYDLVYADLDSFEEDVMKIHDFLYAQTGVDCDLYRFPGGSSNTVSNVSKQDMMEFLYEKGFVYFDWNALSGDAVDASLSEEELNDNIMEYVRSNEGDSVVLMHDLEYVHTTADALQALIDTLLEEGYEICALSDTTPTVQHVSYQGEDQ